MASRIRRSDQIMALGMLAALVIVADLVTVVVRAVPQNEVRLDNPVAVSAPPVSTTLPPTTEAAPTSSSGAPRVAGAQVSRPVRPPGDPRAASPIIQIGSIEIPKIGLLHPIFEGVTLTVIDHGPGHWPGTSMPGEAGNAVFAGHRVTHSHPFLHIDQLVGGDKVILHMPNGDFTYNVVDHVIVSPNDLWIVDPKPGYNLTFFGCHPPHSAKQRYVVRAVLAS